MTAARSPGPWMRGVAQARGRERDAVEVVRTSRVKSSSVPVDAVVAQCPRGGGVGLGPVEVAAQGDGLAVLQAGR